MYSECFIINFYGKRFKITLTMIDIIYFLLCYVIVAYTFCYVIFNINKIYIINMHDEKYKINGLTLIESLIWFAVFSAVMVGVFLLYSASKDKNNTIEMSKELTTIYLNIEQIFENEDTLGLNNDLSMKLGIYPKTTKTKGTIAYNSFGGTINITGSNQKVFTVEYFGIPSGEICSNFVRSQKNTGWYLVNVNGTIVYFGDQYKVSDILDGCWKNVDKSKVVSFVRI